MVCSKCELKRKAECQNVIQMKFKNAKIRITKLADNKTAKAPVTCKGTILCGW